MTMNSEGLTVGGCTCADENGGCGAGKSSCCCDAGAGRSDTKEASRSGCGSCGGSGGSGCGGGGSSGGGCGGGGSGGGSCGGGGGSCGGGGGSCGGGGGSCGQKKDPKCNAPNPPFCAEKVRKILKKVLLELLDSSYSEILCDNLSQRAVSCVRKQVKELNFDPRYKYVCLITVAERSSHNLPVITRTLWDPDTDCCACFSHRTCTAMAIIQCFGILCDKCSPCKPC